MKPTGGVFKIFFYTLSTFSGKLACLLVFFPCVCVCVGGGGGGGEGEVLVLVCQSCHFSSHCALWPLSTPEYSCQYVTGIFQVPKLAALKAASHAKGVRNVFELPVPELYRMEPCLNRHAQGALWIPGETVLEPNVYGVLLAHHAKKNGSKVGQLPVNSLFVMLSYLKGTPLEEALWAQSRGME